LPQPWRDVWRPRPEGELLDVLRAIAVSKGIAEAVDAVAAELQGSQSREGRYPPVGSLGTLRFRDCGLDLLRPSAERYDALPTFRRARLGRRGFPFTRAVREIGLFLCRVPASNVVLYLGLD